MRYLVVHAHPVEESFNKALFRVTVETLRRAGHEVQGLDLYAEGFEPVMGAAERRRYHERGLNVEPVRAYVAQLAWCQGLVFVYPTWWYAQPAMLKGWLERVWLPHECFAMPEGNLPIRPRLQHIEVLGGISTYGAPWWFTRWVGDPGRRIVMRGLKPLMHPRCRTFWCALHRMDSVGAAERKAFVARVVRTLERLPAPLPQVAAAPASG